MKSRILKGLAVLILVAAPATVLAQENEKLDQLIADLNALIERAEQEKLADPWFISDMKDLVARYSETWPVQIHAHTFDSKGPAPDKPWRVSQGEMKIDWSRGLRSVVEEEPEEQQSSGDDLLKGIIGSVVKKALDDDGSSSSSASSDPSTPALALAPVGVTNAFKLETVFSGREHAAAESGAFEVGVYQGESLAGYRVQFRPTAGGEGGEVLLYVKSSNGNSRVVESRKFKGGVLNDQALSLVWERYSDGRATVSLAGADLIDVVDRSFSDRFTGLMIGNTGGDYAVKSITVHGTER